MGGLGPALAHVDSRLKDLDVTYEEWEVLFRQRLLLRLVAQTKVCGGSGDGSSESETHGGRHPASGVRLGGLRREVFEAR